MEKRALSSNHLYHAVLQKRTPKMLFSTTDRDASFICHWSAQANICAMHRSIFVVGMNTESPTAITSNGT